MHKESVDDVLFLFHKFLALFQPVTLALDVNDGAMMQNTIKDCGGDGNIGKDLIPLRECFVGSEDGRNFLISSGDKLKEKVSAMDVHRKVSNLVDNEQLVFTKNPQPVRKPVLVMGFFELFNEVN